MPRAINETPSGAVSSTDGIDGNAIFTLAHLPTSPSSVALYGAGARRTRGVHFLITGQTITYISGSNPLAGDTHLADYSY